MKIVSLLSSATEIVYALGIEAHLVGISHECDFPPDALELPRFSRSRFDPAGLDSAEIDRAVRRCMEQFGSVYEVDAAALEEVAPDLILTQGVCEVCAVPTGAVEEAVASLPKPPRVLSLDAHTLDGILLTIQQVADAAGETERGRQSVGRLRNRLEQVRDVVRGRLRPRVLALEWLEPPFAPGHWVPEMVEHAGGENLLGSAGARSAEIPWPALDGLDPDHLLILPCGYDLDQARQDANRSRARLEQVGDRAIRDGHAWIGHGSYFSRSGPRVVDGIETIAAALHPECFEERTLAPRLARWQPVSPEAAVR